MLSVLRLIPQPPGKIEQGEVLFGDRDLLKLSAEDIRYVRGAEIAMIFQDPMTSLNPVMTIGKQISEPMLEHLGMTEQEAFERAGELLNLVGIPQAAERLNDYPHQFSGGMRQRVMIAMALSCNPKILIADEPTTALDVTIQAQIVDLVRELRDRLGMAIIWITHDLGIIAGLAEHVKVMYAGYVVEEADVRDVYSKPKHPYTNALLASLPRVDGKHGDRLANIEGRPPDLLQMAMFCPFAPRCDYVREICWSQNPALRSVAGKHKIACWVDIDSNELIAEAKVASNV
jgi:oligopeptide/dipeptide ABC transporter ATP-binding protein